jgi:polygalacturonase
MARCPVSVARRLGWDSPLKAYLDDATRERFDGSFNVKSSVYGAKGDGVTDDTAAIQAAISAANVAGGGEVFVGPGTFMVTGISPSSGVRLRGAGQGLTTIKQIAGTPSALIGASVSALDSVEVCDLTLDGNKANQASTSAKGLSFTAFTNSAIRRVTVKNTYGLGIQLYTGSGLVVEDCYLTGIGQGTSIDGSRAGIIVQTADKITLVNNRLDSINDTGLCAVAGCTNVLISGNTVSTCFYEGIGLGAGQTNNCVVSHNVVRSTGNNGIDTGDARSVTITGNVIDTCLAGIVEDASALSVRTDLALVIVGNKVSNASNHGIAILGTTNGGHNVVVSNNAVDGTGWSGIQLSSVGESTVIGNTIRNVSTAVAGFSGIALGSNGTTGCTGVLVVANRIYDSANGYGIDRGTGGTGAAQNNNNNYVGNQIRGCSGAPAMAGTAGPNDVLTLPGVQALTYGVTVNTSADTGPIFTLVVTNGTAFTIAAPTNPTFGREITYDVKNSSGGAMGVITWNAPFLLAGAFVNPANTKRRTITFYYDGTSWVEKNRAAADI